MMRLAQRQAVALLLGSSALLAGCQGVQPGKSPSDDFVVSTSIEQVYARAIEQSRYCLVTEDRFPLTASLAADKQSGSVRVNMTLTGTLLSEVTMRADGPNQTRVTVRMWGVDVWDANAISAMRAAIEFGVPSCTNYFPSAADIKKRR